MAGGVPGFLDQFRGVQQGLRGNATHMKACATRKVSDIDQCHLKAMIRGKKRRCISTRARAQDRQIHLNGLRHFAPKRIWNVKSKTRQLCVKHHVQRLFKHGSNPPKETGRLCPVNHTVIIGEGDRQHKPWDRLSTL